MNSQERVEKLDNKLTRYNVGNWKCLSLTDNSIWKSKRKRGKGEIVKFFTLPDIRSTLLKGSRGGEIVLEDRNASDLLTGKKGGEGTRKRLGGGFSILFGF